MPVIDLLEKSTGDDAAESSDSPIFSADREAPLPAAHIAWVSGAASTTIHSAELGEMSGLLSQKAGVLRQASMTRLSFLG